MSSINSKNPARLGGALSLVRRRPFFKMKHISSVLAICLISCVAACHTATAPQFELCRAELIEQLIFNAEDERVLIVAHRGAHDITPENSLSGIRRAAKLGAAVVELDVRRTSDGVYVLMHDETIDRTTNGTGEIADLSFETVGSLRLLSADGEVTNETVPTLADALETSKNLIWIMLDSKVDDPSSIQEIGQIVNGAGMGRQVVLYDYAPETLMAYKEAIPEARVMLRSKNVADISDYVSRYTPDIYHLEPEWISVEIADKFRSLKISTWFNTFGTIENSALDGDTDEIFRFISIRPDFIQTDHPAEMAKWLAASGLHPNVLSQGGVQSCR